MSEAQLNFQRAWDESSGLGSEIREPPAPQRYRAESVSHQCARACPSRSGRFFVRRIPHLKPRPVFLAQPPPSGGGSLLQIRRQGREEPAATRLLRPAECRPPSTGKL